MSVYQVALGRGLRASVMSTSEDSVGYRCPSSFASLNSQSRVVQSGTRVSSPRLRQRPQNKSQKNFHHESKKMMDKITVAMSPTVIMPIPITFHCVASSAEVVGASGTLENVGAIELDMYIGASDVAATVDGAMVLDVVMGAMVPATIVAAEAVLGSGVVAVRVGLVVVLRYVCVVLVIAVTEDRSWGVSAPRSATRSRFTRGTAATMRTSVRRMSERMCRMMTKRDYLFNCKSSTRYLSLVMSTGEPMWFCHQVCPCPQPSPRPVLTTLLSVAQRCVLSWFASFCPPSLISHPEQVPHPICPSCRGSFVEKVSIIVPCRFLTHVQNRLKILPMIHATIALQGIWTTLKGSIPSSVRFFSNRFPSTTHLHSEHVLLSESESSTTK